MTKFVADLHLHSAYARATSRNLNFDTLSEWALYKGIQLLSSADFTHPVWWEETKKKLKESKYPGFYHYLPDSKAGKNLHFVLGSEISCIYTQGGRMRRMHCLLFFPDKKDVDLFNSRLGKKANLRADGRPIIGMSAKNLLEFALEINPDVIFIPAHAWTPWFSLYGSNSGFDSIDEAFGDLSKYIYAIETGLSSDPPMNWRIKELDNRSIVSFSDAHSMAKMSRELTVFESDFSFDGLLKALKKQKIALTVEFFPEEGKYHYSGHRNCGVRLSPSETEKNGMICPKCSRKLTIGVMHRVEELAEKSRPEGFKPKNRPDFKSTVPLHEIIAESMKRPVASPAVLEEYKKLVAELGSEMNILFKSTQAEIEKAASTPRIAQGVFKVRKGDIVVEPGFDGVFGVVKIWNNEEKDLKEKKVEIKKEDETSKAEGQVGLFD